MTLPRTVRVRPHPRRLAGGAATRVAAHTRNQAASTIKVRRNGKWVPVSDKQLDELDARIRGAAQDEWRRRLRAAEARGTFRHDAHDRWRGFMRDTERTAEDATPARFRFLRDNFDDREATFRHALGIEAQRYLEHPRRPDPAPPTRGEIMEGWRTHRSFADLGAAHEPWDYEPRRKAAP